jgi:hypothetical protein
VPCVCFRVQSRSAFCSSIPGLRPVWSFCTPVSAWLFSAYHSPLLLVRVCTMFAPVFCSHPAFMELLI